MTKLPNVWLMQRKRVYMELVIVTLFLKINFVLFTRQLQPAMKTSAV